MKTKLTLMIALLAMGCVQHASAAVHGLTVSQMLNQTVDSSVAYSNLFGWSAAPTYGDGVTMSGAAGANDFLGINGNVFFALTANDLADFKAAASDGDTYAMNVWNDDNNDPWIAGLWFEDGSGVQSVEVLENPDGVSSRLSIVMPNISSITKLGTYIKNPSGDQGDAYHVSFAIVPEPGTMAIWTLLGGIGLVVSRRRKG